MKRKLLPLFALGIIIHFAGFSQDRKWTVHEFNKENLTVKSEVVDGKNDRGDEIKIMHYVVEKVGKLSLFQAENYLRNSDNYKLFWESMSESREIKRISENEWETYFLFDAIWPMPKSDCVQRFTFIRNGESGFKLKANVVPNEMLQTEYEKVTIYQVQYDFTKLNETELKLTLSVSSSPAINPPKFLMRAWFPKGPAGVVNRFFENASGQ